MKMFRQPRFLGFVAVILVLIISTSILLSSPLHTTLARFFYPQPPRALGVAIDGFPGQAPALLDAYAREVGGTPAAAEWYVSMTDPFNTQRMNDFSSRGVVPLISSGNPSQYTDAQIAGGAIDPSLHAFARAAASWGKPFFYRMDWEMNGDWMGFGPGQNGNTNETFIAMWRHVVTLMRQDGMKNGWFVFSPNTLCAGACRDFTPMYPGNDYVDWVGLDGYNWGTVQPYSHWDSFDTTFRASYDKLVALASGKPVMVAETGSTEQGGNKADWIQQAFFQEIPDHYTQLKLIVWFDFNKETDWRIDSSSAALQAYRQVVASADYKGALVDPSTLRGTAPTAKPTVTPTIGGVTPPPTATTTSIVTGAQPTVTPTPTAGKSGTVSTSKGAYFTSFEDGTLDNWGGYDTSVSLMNSTKFAYLGEHALQLSYHNITEAGYHQTDIAGGTLGKPSPLPGQTLTAYVYVPANSAAASAHIYVEDTYHQWHAGPMISLSTGTWTKLTYVVPTTIPTPTFHMGIQFANKGGQGYSGTIYIDDITWN
jgi:mannan endo-1,4-beta-mannosidase